MIIMLMVMPSICTTRNAIMNEIGIEVPIIRAGRTPRVATQVTITSATAVSTAASSERNRFLVESAWSTRKLCWIPDGQSLVNSVVTERTLSEMSMTLVPSFLITPSVIACWPLTCAYSVASLKVRVTVATSPKVTTLSPSALIGSE